MNYVTIQLSPEDIRFYKGLWDEVLERSDAPSLIICGEAEVCSVPEGVDDYLSQLGDA